MRLVSIKTIQGRIHMLSGLHIGAGRDTIEIGGLDQPVIKHPINNAPYIPGSSMKGKMRSLLETYYFVDREETRKWVVGSGQACGCSLPDCPSCRIFGTSGAQKSEEIGPTRIIVRDALLTEHFFEQFKNNKWNTEVKYENTINRVTGTADNPRPLERVPAGVEFNLNISFKVFENDEPELIDFVYKGLKLIQLDALGGNSSRGCGHVVFKEVKCNGQDIDLEQMTL